MQRCHSGSGKFGVEQKVQYTLLLPVAVVALLGIYVAFKVAMSKRVKLEAFKASHGGRTPAEIVSRQVLAISTGTFVFASTFFLKNVLSAWNCTHSNDGGAFLKSQPDIPCSSDNEEYARIELLGTVGLLGYAVMFTIVSPLVISPFRRSKSLTQSVSMASRTCMAAVHHRYLCPARVVSVLGRQV
jgi:hypothetical protein